MTESTTQTPLTISVGKFAEREALKGVPPEITDPKARNQNVRAAYQRILDQTGQRIMAGTLIAYAFNNGKPEVVVIDVQPRHPLIAQLSAWLDGKRTQPSPRGLSVTINGDWISRLHIDDVDHLAELHAARNRIAELEKRLAELETGGVLIEGKEPEELDQAITLYRRVARCALPENCTPLQALKQKAEELYPQWLPTKVERLATVCNWDKSPGKKKK